MKEEVYRKLEEERSTHEAEWAAAMDSSDDSIYILDPERRIIRANKAFYRMTASSPEKAIGRHITEVVHPHGELEPCPVCRAQEEKKDTIIIMEADHPDNPAGVPLEIVVKVARNSTGEPMSIFMSLHDLTEGRKLVEEKRVLEEQLRQAQKMESIGRLAGGIAHDFNNVLTTILGYSELLLITMPEDDSYRKQIEIIHTAGEKARALTRQLLAFSRKQILEMRPVCVNAVISDLLKILGKMLGEDVEIVPCLNAESGIVEADPGQIEQVLMNLSVNARDAMPAGGRLVIETQDVFLDEEYAKIHPEVTTGPYVMVSVTDFGEGMGEEILEHLFEPFFTTKESDKGTGLGLATVHGIIQQHNGQIYVYSEPGQGTTFKIYLPASDKSLEHKEKKIIALSSGGETILVVDDETSIRKFMLHTLQLLGYKCLEASCGEDAIRLIKASEEEIHLLLTDVIMPGMGGPELARRAAMERPSMKVLFVSGYTENAIAHHGILNANINYLAKPVTPTSLAGKIREILDG
ncbi:MAG TPA: response regulator [Desulfobulbus sp.]|nr:response regulator [Desulfobulbus sp.]